MTAPARPRFPPVALNETLRVEITAVGKQGDGVAKVQGGFVVIVPGTKVGEKHQIRVTKVSPTCAFAEVVPPKLELLDKGAVEQR